MKRENFSNGNNDYRPTAGQEPAAEVKRKYFPMEISSLSIESENALLTGSVLDQKIMVNTVTVETYQDGFEGAPEDEWTITFE